MDRNGRPKDIEPIMSEKDYIPPKKFEVKMRTHPDGSVEKAIFIGGEKLDYSIDMDDYHKACKLGFGVAVQQDIERHFIESVSEFLGRKITKADLIEAIQTGWI